MKKVHRYCIEEDGVYKVCFSSQVDGNPMRGTVGIAAKPGKKIPEPDWDCVDFEGVCEFLSGEMGIPVELMEADEYIRQEMEDPEEVEE